MRPTQPTPEPKRPKKRPQAAPTTTQTESEARRTTIKPGRPAGIHAREVGLKRG